LPDDVAALDRTIDHIGGPVVLVGHAYAGAVIGESTHEQIRALVYVALPDDVAALDRTIDHIGGPVVLVGHAYAGAVIGESTHEQIRALVYVAALAPDAGETVADVFYREPPHPAAPQLAPDADGYIWLPSAAFAAAFAQNADADQLTVLAAVQRPIAAACIQQPVSEPGWRRLPIWYLRADQDRMINPATQAFLSERMGA
ncbi:alpha/beta hydrolase, partial [Mycolicibacterium sp. CBMA 361]|uniref:alpha/beta hydrolase n=1 Tax=Mycolicibacterium sp. CBMA 361 TaxID=2606610 RepID=UPI00193DB4C4